VRWTGSGIVNAKTRVRVLYLARGTEDLYNTVRGYLPADFELVTLAGDTPEEVYRHLPECEVIVVATRRLDAAMIAAATQLRLVVHQGVGYHDTVDAPALRERGVALAITPDGTATTVAEHAVMLMLAACRHLAFADSELRAGRFHVNALRLKSQTLAGRKIGYIGMGRIGRATALRLREWGTSGLYVDPLALPGTSEAELGVRRVTLDELLAQADIVSLHVPLTQDTRTMIDARAFARMKAGAVLVNTARGPVVDQAALVSALDSGHLGAAGFDVFEQEPVTANHPLARFENVVLTPHIAAATRDTFDAKMSGVFERIRRFYADEPMQDQVF